MLKPIFWPVLAPSLLFAVGVGAMLPVMVLGALDLGSTSSFAAAIVGLMGAVALVTAVPAGMLIDRLGDFRSMVVATLIALVVIGVAIAAFVWPTPYSIVLYTASLLAFAPVSNVWNLARQAVVAETMPSKDLSTAMTALGGSMRVGNLVGPIVGAGLLLVWPLWSVFAFAAASAVAAVIIMALPIARLPEPAVGSPGYAAASSSSDLRRSGAGRNPRRGGSHVTGSAEPPRREDGTADGTRPGPRREDGNAAKARLDVRWDAVLLAGASIMALTIARSAQPVVVQLWGVHIGLHSSAISLIIAFGAALELIFMVGGAYIKDHLGRATTLVVCMSIFGAGFVVMVALPSLAGMIIAAGVMAVGNGLGAGVNMTIGADLSPTVGRARFLGFWAIFSNGGKLAGPTVISIVLTVSSLPLSVLMPGLLTLAGAVWTVVWAKRMGLPGRLGAVAGRVPAGTEAATGRAGGGASGAGGAEGTAGGRTAGGEGTAGRAEDAAGRTEGAAGDR